MKVLLILFLFSLSVFANTIEIILPKNISEQELLEATQHNQSLFDNDRFQNFNNKNQNSKKLRPITDFDKIKYLFMNASSSFASDAMKVQIAKNLPKDTYLVLMTSNYNLAPHKSEYSKYTDRLIFVILDYPSDTFWSRDALPFPILNKDGTYSLLKYKYFRSFDEHHKISEFLSSNIKSEYKDYIFVGGNLLADEFGNCFVVESSRLFKLSDAVFINDFSCATITRLPHLAGIGDVDEVIKILPNKRIMTNIVEYYETLRKLGYQVIPVPKLTGYRTYINSTIVNDTVFVPTYNLSTDQEALEIYRKQGYKVVPLNSIYSSDTGQGSIHCMTMGYPEVDIESLF